MRYAATTSSAWRRLTDPDPQVRAGAAALLLIPVVLLINYQAPRSIVWLVLATVSLLALREFFSLAEKLSFLPYRIAGYGVCALLVVLPGSPESALIIGFALGLLVLTACQSTVEAADWLGQLPRGGLSR